MVLKFEVIRKFTDIVILLISMHFGVENIAWGMALVSLISLFYYMLPAQKFLGYKILHQIRDILPQLILSLVMGISVYAVFYITGQTNLMTLLFQVLVGSIVYICLACLFKIDSMNYIIKIIRHKLRTK